MPAIAVQITRFVDEHIPGFVECMLIDAAGKLHRFVEKAPVVSRELLKSDSKYPCDGVVECHVEESLTDAAGRVLCRINTAHPFSIESTNGETQFLVFASQVKG